MNIEELRLDEDELDDLMCKPPVSVTLEILSPEEIARKIANTATDKANRWWIEWVDNMIIGTTAPFSKRMTEGCLILDINPIQWSDLKKLVEE